MGLGFEVKIRFRVRVGDGSKVRFRVRVGFGVKVRLRVRVWVFGFVVEVGFFVLG